LEQIEGILTDVQERASGESMTSNEEQTQRIDLEAHRPPGASSWDLPEWGDSLARAVYPLFATKDGRLFPIGTAFCMSKLGIVASALHNVLAGLRLHRRYEELIRRLPNDYTLDDMGFSVFHHVPTPGGGFRGTVRGVEGFQGAPPTDIAYGFPQFLQGLELLSAPLSFLVPRVGSRVVCVGYAEMESPVEGICFEALLSGAASWDQVYSHRFRAVEARVDRIFTQRFARGYIEGPCFTMGVEVDHGMSGGPVLTQDGHVCGVVSAGASRFFNRPATIASLLYPTILTGIKFGVQLGPVRMNATHPLVALIAQGAVVTDGSEERVALVSDGEGIRIGPLIHRDDCSNVHDDFAGYQAGEMATRGSREFYQIRIHRDRGRGEQR
jgi:hypothetical protein